MDDPVVIVALARTPMAGLGGALSSRMAPELGAAALRAALERGGVAGEELSEVLMGNVLSAGLGQAPARQAALGAGVPESVPATGVSKVCGSGMKAVMLGHDAILAGSARIVAAGGMESMSNAPYLLPKLRGGARLGHAEAKDHMFLDGLEDAYERGRLMGVFADRTAAHLGIGRAEQDDYALRSLERALAAGREGRFAKEIAPVEGGEGVLDHDTAPLRAKPARIPELKPAFGPEGTVTAANASSISDGAAAVVLMRRSEALARGAEVLATVRAAAAHARAPEWFTTAPVGAAALALERAGWAAGDVDLWEINEAFAVVVLAAMRELGLGAERVNVNGGACALGHPIGASGARILVTLVAALRARGGGRGLATLCIGGGEATAVALEA